MPKEQSDDRLNIMSSVAEVSLTYWRRPGNCDSRTVLTGVEKTQILLEDPLVCVLSNNK